MVLGQLEKGQGEERSDDGVAKDERGPGHIPCRDTTQNLPKKPPESGFPGWLEDQQQTSLWGHKP